MSIPLHISPRLIPSISSLYNDTNRIFMEYIDNALDSAEEYFDQANNKYKIKIKICLKLEGNSYKNGKVTISDNCAGITNFTKVVQSIGNSDKRGQFTTNGQFGYGIYSFMAACEKLEIISKTNQNNALSMPILRSQFNKDKQEDVKFPDPKEILYPETENSGTIIILSNFDKEAWKTIDTNIIQTEIEKHFELLLNRANLEIKIVYNTNEEYICKAFNYTGYEGDVWEEKISELNTIQKGRGKGSDTTYYVKLEHPIEIFLKITKGKVIDKKPVFIIKGRRIGEIRGINSFKSVHKSDIWGHPNLTGYIDLKDSLEPTIARNDFKNTPKSKAVFEELIKLEEYILEFLKDINQQSEERHYKELEDELSKALSKLARFDNMNYRTVETPGTKDPGFPSDNRNTTFKDNRDSENKKEEKEFYSGDGKYNWEGDEDNPQLNNNDHDNIEEDSKTPETPDNPFEDSKNIADEKKKSGFNIKIDDREPDIDDETNEALRSTLIGGTIFIFRKHPDFQARVGRKQTGESKISQRLITYLAGEITVHYKDKFVTREGQPDYNKKMFSNVVDFIYKFEDMLSGLNGKNLSDLTNGTD